MSCSVRSCAPKCGLGRACRHGQSLSWFSPRKCVSGDAHLEPSTSRGSRRAGCGREWRHGSVACRVTLLDHEARSSTWGRGALSLEGDASTAAIAWWRLRVRRARSPAQNPIRCDDAAIVRLISRTWLGSVRRYRCKLRPRCNATMLLPTIRQWR